MATGRQITRVVLGAGLVGLVAACANVPVAQAPRSAVAATVDLPPADPAPPSASQSAGAPAATVALVPAASGARALVGLGREALVARLGPAAFVRRDGPAEVWRYRTGECYFEAFLYRDDLLGQRVAHVDARSLIGRPMPVDACFAQLGSPKQG